MLQLPCHRPRVARAHKYVLALGEVPVVAVSGLETEYVVVHFLCVFAALGVHERYLVFFKFEELNQHGALQLGHSPEV